MAASHCTNAQFAGSQCRPACNASFQLDTSIAEDFTCSRTANGYAWLSTATNQPVSINRFCIGIACELCYCWQPNYLNCRDRATIGQSGVFPVQIPPQFLKIEFRATGINVIPRFNVCGLQCLIVFLPDFLTSFSFCSRP
jgi:hypothetical protein